MKAVETTSNKVVLSYLLCSLTCPVSTHHTNPVLFTVVVTFEERRRFPSGGTHVTALDRLPRLRGAALHQEVGTVGERHVVGVELCCVWRAREHKTFI